MGGTDQYMRMGSDHSICQDYVIAGSIKDQAYAILADGCSGEPIPGQPGSPYTDVGARVLVRAAQMALERFMLKLEGQFIPEAVVRHADGILGQLNYPSQALDATLMVAQETETDIIVRMYGDGVLATRTRDGIVSYTSLEFDGNSPYYLNYLTKAGRHQAFRDMCKTVQVTHRRRVDGVWQSPLEETNLIGDIELSRIYSKANYDLVLLLSDGAKSFVKGGNPVPVEDVLDQVFAFKGLKGEYLTRRLNFFEKFCREQGWRHKDDLSVAGIHLP